MESIISLLSNIEKEASEIVDKSIEKKNEMYSVLKKDIANIDEEYSNRLQKELEDIEEKCKKEQEEVLSNLRTRAEQDIDKLEIAYTKNHDKYIDTLLKKIISLHN